MTDSRSSEAATIRSGLLQVTDSVLRGRYTTKESLAQGRVDVQTGILVRLGILLGVIYGASLGAYALCHGGDRAWLQLFASAAKLPLLFLLTLLVTFPSLYVFSALQRSPLRPVATLRLLMVAIVVDLAVLASLGPVFAFFAASTQSYQFLLLLNVAFCGLAGIISLVVLRRATNIVFESGEGGKGEAARRVLLVWCVVYGTVGAQMGWLLRPFLGAPGAPFELFRARESSFFECVLLALRHLLFR
jgi:hypothetical protein